MAKVLFTAAVADARGKLNGTVFSKNRGGAYIRTKVSPVNAQTPAQQGVRASLSNFAQAWRGLTANQRAGWNGAVENYKKTDIFGNSRNPSGFNLYVRLNQNLSTISQTPIDDAPLPSSVGSPGALTVTAAAGTPALSIAFANAPVPADTTMVIQGTAQVSQGKNFVKNLFRQFRLVVAAGTSPVNALAAYNTKFGTLVAGTKIGIRAYYISDLTGIAGIAETATVIVAA